MTRTRLRTIVRVLIVAVVLVATAPALAAKSPGAIALTGPTRGSWIKGSVPITWTYKTGTALKSTSKVELWSAGVQGWKKIAQLPASARSFTWDTKGLDDYIYTIRARVAGTKVYSTITSVYVDNTAPVVTITRPSQNQIVIEDESPERAIVVGPATLEAAAYDNFTGIKKVTWYLNDTVTIGTGARIERYSFPEPGEHLVTARAEDRAGNTAEHTISVVALPGPSAAGVDVDVPNEDDAPGQDDVPPGIVPDDPSAPDEDDLPAVKVPDPNDEPPLGLPNTDELPGPEDIPPPPSELPDQNDAPSMLPGEDDLPSL